MWFVFALLSALFAGVQSFLSKVVAERKYDSYHVSTSSALVALGATLVLLLFSGESFANLPPLLLWLGLASGLLYIGRTVTQFESLQFIDSALFFPLYKVIGPVVVTAIGIFIFRDSLSLPVLTGIVLSCMLPLLLITRAEHARQKDLGLGLFLMLASTVLAAITTAVNAYAVQTDASFTIPYMAIAYGFSAVLGVGFFVRRHGLGNAHAAMKAHSSFQALLLGSALGVLQCLSFLFLLLAFQGNSVSVIYSIQAHYILIPVLLSVWLYKEHWNTQKALALIVSLLALILLHR